MANKGRTVMVQGRVIWAVGGSLFKGKPTMNKQTNQQKLDKNNNPIVQRGFGLAIDKVIFSKPENMQVGGVGEFWQALHDEAWTLYPDRQVPKNFAWKKIDGDLDSDETGRMWSTKEGYAGHIVLPCTTNLPIAFYKYDAVKQKPELVNDGIKVGDFVQVQLNICAHPAVRAQDGSMGKPGLYLNPLSVLFLAAGNAIITQQDGEDIFGKQPIAPAAWMNVVQDNSPQMGQMAQMPGAAPMPNQQQQYAPHPQQPVQQFHPQQPQAPMQQQYAPQPGQPYQQPQAPMQPPAPQPNYEVVPQQFHPQQPQAPMQQQYAPQPGQPYQQPQAGAPMPGAPMPPGYQPR